MFFLIKNNIHEIIIKHPGKFLTQFGSVKKGSKKNSNSTTCDKLLKKKDEDIEIFMH